MKQTTIYLCLGFFAVSYSMEQESFKKVTLALPPMNKKEQEISPRAKSAEDVIKKPEILVYASEFCKKETPHGSNLLEREFSRYTLKICLSENKVSIYEFVKPGNRKNSNTFEISLQEFRDIVARLNQKVVSPRINT